MASFISEVERKEAETNCLFTLLVQIVCLDFVKHLTIIVSL
jgi:hypothetical protein